MTDVAILAVLGNPALKAQRLQRGVARAQAFAAGLLPDPQLIANIDPVTNAMPGLVTAWGFGLSYDIQSLITHGAKRKAARAAAEKVDLETLWQEWQVIQQARLLYVERIVDRRKLALLRQAHALYSHRYRESAVGLRQGTVTIETAGPDLTALLDLESRIGQTEQHLEQARHDLTALLGLAPDVTPKLGPFVMPVALDPAVVKSAISSLTKRRPDLLALQAGYQAQEETVRGAILAQFPSINFGITRASDTSNVHTVSLGVTMNLPFLNANRGEIAVQRATRAQLRAAYQARLDQSIGEVARLHQLAVLLRRQIAALDAKLPDLMAMTAKAETANRAQDISTLVYLNLKNGMVQKRMERVDLARQLWTTRIAIDTILGWPLGAPLATQGRRPRRE